MSVAVKRCTLSETEPFRERFRRESSCQIVHYSVLPRGLADSYLLLHAGTAVGYAGVWNRYHPGRVVECYIAPEASVHEAELFRQLVEAAGATHIEAQTNIRGMHALALRWARQLDEEKLLFEDQAITRLPCPEPAARLTGPPGGAVGEWTLSLGAKVIATGGVTSHYNPPYRDVYMEVAEQWRRRGFGSYLVQALKEACYAAHTIPAARCDPDNVASRKTLEKAGFAVCGRLVAGAIRAA